MIVDHLEKEQVDSASVGGPTPNFGGGKRHTPGGGFFLSKSGRPASGTDRTETQSTACKSLAPEGKSLCQKAARQGASTSLTGGGNRIRGGTEHELRGWDRGARLC